MLAYNKRGAMWECRRRSVVPGRVGYTWEGVVDDSVPELILERRIGVLYLR